MNYYTSFNVYRQFFLLDFSNHFLNHGSFGACPIPVFQTYQDWQRRLENQPVLFLGREYSDYDLQARKILAEYLNTIPSNLSFVTNATQGVNIISHSLKLSPGDEILSTDHEYGACEYAWEFACQRSGAKYIRQQIPLPVSSENELFDLIWEGVSSQTRVIYLSHITSPTALRLPVERVCQQARENGILTIVDGAHAPGQISLNLETLGADFYVGNCHKWLMAPKGAGFLYARPEVQNLIDPLIVSWGYRSTPTTTAGSQFLDYLQWTGTRDPSAALSVPAAVEFMAQHQWDHVQMDTHQLLRQTIERICDLVSMLPLYPLHSNLFHQMGIAPLPQSIDLGLLKTRLYSEYKVEVPMIEWNDRNFIRISIQAYNTQEDCDALLLGLENLLPKLKR
jgi:isopenicillin-N epimerase